MQTIHLISGFSAENESVALLREMQSSLLSIGCESVQFFNIEVSSGEIVRLSLDSDAPHQAQSFDTVGAAELVAMYRFSDIRTLVMNEGFRSGHLIASKAVVSFEDLILNRTPRYLITPPTLVQLDREASMQWHISPRPLKGVHQGPGHHLVSRLFQRVEACNWLASNFVFHLTQTSLLRGWLVRSGDGLRDKLYREVARRVCELAGASPAIPFVSWLEGLARKPHLFFVGLENAPLPSCDVVVLSERDF